MTEHDFLIEIGTEELPPKALKTLAQAFADGIATGLRTQKLEFTAYRWFATPRRLAVKVDALNASAADETIEVQGPPAAAAKDPSGAWSKAALGFAAKQGVAPDALLTVDTDKGPRLACRVTNKGAVAREVLPAIVEQALQQLPIPKRMRWGSSRTEFVRPAHWLVMLYGSELVPGQVLGLSAGNNTRGHRFHCDTTLDIANPAAYEKLLADSGHVIACFDQRRAQIRQQAEALGQKLGGRAVIDDDLLDEVTSLVEWPVALAGSFEPRFLQIPAEALISSMSEHQKYFHVVDVKGQLLPHFITVANIVSNDPSQVIAGNERVIRPRLTDAAFFFDTDRKTPLSVQRERLKPIVFQAQLGSLFDKTERIAALSVHIANLLGADTSQARRAGELSKADLVTNMVGEFDRMQGIAGCYYAQHDGEAADVAQALREHYLPRFAGDELPATNIGISVALADRLDTLVGIFGIGQKPSGSKDPFALRRASLGVLRIIVEKSLALDLHALLQQAAQPFTAIIKNPDALVEEVLSYMLERMRAWYEDKAIPTEVFLAVQAKQLSQPLDIHQRVLAVHSFSQLPEAAALAAANKRVANILSQAQTSQLPTLDVALLADGAEAELAAQIGQRGKQVQPLFEQQRYQEGLAQLAGLRAAVDRFFDEVMVMVDDPAVRANRLVLLKQLAALFLEVADISQLVPARQ